MNYTFDAMKLILDVIPEQTGIKCKNIKVIYHNKNIQPIFNGNVQTNIEFKVSDLCSFQEEIIVLDEKLNLHYLNLPNVKEIELELIYPHNISEDSMHYWNVKQMTYEQLNSLFNKTRSLDYFDERMNYWNILESKYINFETVDYKQFTNEQIDETSHNLINKTKIEVDKMLRQITNDISFEQMEINPPKKFCNHEWKNYVGLSQTYDYCTKCDERRL